MRVLTEASVMLCAHKTGKVTRLASQFFAHVEGSRILVAGDPAFKPISGCSNVGATIKPCTATLVQTAGSSQLLFVGGKPACLDTVRGTTDGTPPGIVEFDVAQPGHALVEVAS